MVLPGAVSVHSSPRFLGWTSHESGRPDLLRPGSMNANASRVLFPGRMEQVEHPKGWPKVEQVLRLRANLSPPSRFFAPIHPSLLSLLSPLKSKRRRRMADCGWTVDHRARQERIGAKLVETYLV